MYLDNTEFYRMLRPQKETVVPPAERRLHPKRKSVKCESTRQFAAFELIDKLNISADRLGFL